MPIGLKSLLRNETRPLIQVRVTLRHVGSGGGTVTLVVSRALDSAMLVREVGEAVLVAVLSSTLVRHSRGLMRKGAKTNNRALESSRRPKHAERLLECRVQPVPEKKQRRKRKPY